MKRIFGLLTVVMVLLLVGCAKKKPYDYTNFRESKPKSILVLPPVNQSTEVKATHSVLSTATLPLAEAGYYVLPVAVVEETFAQNGLTSASDIHAVSLQKLYEIFGADAVLYLDVVKYGTTYAVIYSETRVSVTAKLVDLRTGKQLWAGSATASSEEGKNLSNQGLLGMLISAAVSQIMETVSDKGFDIGGVANSRLLSAGHSNGILYGPRSPQYTIQK